MTFTFELGIFRYLGFWRLSFEILLSSFDIVNLSFGILFSTFDMLVLSFEIIFRIFGFWFRLYTWG